MRRWAHRLLAVAVSLLVTLAWLMGCGRAQSSGLFLFETMSDGKWTIWQMNGDGTGRRAVVPWDEAVQGYGVYPKWAPDGRHFAYTYGYEEGDQYRESVRIADRDGGHTLIVGEPADSVASGWMSSDLLYFMTVRAGTVMTDIYQLSSGVIRDYEPPGLAGSREWALSPDGATVALREEGSLDYVLLDVRSGKRTIILQAPEKARDETVFGGHWSPDGKTLAFTYINWNEVGLYQDLYTVQADGSGLRPLTAFASEPYDKGSPLQASFVTWSPDGQWLAFYLHHHTTGLYLCVMPAAGGEIINLGIKPKAQETPVWSPDSSKLAFVTNQPFADGQFGDPKVNAQWDLYTVDIHTKAIQRLTDDPALEMYVGWR